MAWDSHMEKNKTRYLLPIQIVTPQITDLNARTETLALLEDKS